MPRTVPPGNGEFVILRLGYRGRSSCGRQRKAKGPAGELADSEWRRIAGLRVVISWPQGMPPPSGGSPGSLRARIAGVLGVLLLLCGAAAVGVAVLIQQHAPRPSASAAGTTGDGHGPRLRRSVPVSVAIPAIGVDSVLLHLGLNADGTMRVPSLVTASSRAAWYKYSATPGQLGVSVIEGHVDSYHGPAIFYRLGGLRPGDRVIVKLANGITAVFRVTGVREYPKAHFPLKTVYGATDHAALRLITCGGSFDYASRSYLSSTVVFASLASSRRPGGVRA